MATSFRYRYTRFTHNIENLGDTDMVTIMWANEPFNPDKPTHISWRFRREKVEGNDGRGTRPEIIRLSAVIKKLEESEAIETHWSILAKIMTMNLTKCF